MYTQKLRKYGGSSSSSSDALCLKFLFRLSIFLHLLSRAREEEKKERSGSCQTEGEWPPSNVLCSLSLLLGSLVFLRFAAPPFSSLSPRPTERKKERKKSWLEGRWFTREGRER